MKCYGKQWPAWLWVVIFFTPTGTVVGHTMAPVLLSITQETAVNYQVVWSFSQDQGAVNPALLSLRFAPTCLRTRSAIVPSADNLWISKEAYQCPDLEGTSLRATLIGLETADAAVAVRIIDSNGNERLQLLNDTRSEFVITGDTAQQGIFSQYLQLGVEHIFGGADHLLFVVALCFLARGQLRKLVVLITAFTLAHSITLSAAALGWITLPSGPIEALIALSIALVAVDLFNDTHQSLRRAANYWPLVFIFGLLHGLGFAGALAEYGLPESAMLMALIAFNLGVEAGQLCLVAVCSLLIYLAHRIREPGWLDPAVGLTIGCTAGFWLVARII